MLNNIEIIMARINIYYIARINIYYINIIKIEEIKDES